MNPRAQALLPVFFVLLWSTGFIGAKLGLPHAEPLTFLSVRYALVVAVMLLVALASRAPWPEDWRSAGHIAINGLLLHGLYLGGVFVSIDHGLPAGIASLVVGMQPLLTAVGAGWLLGERVSSRQWLGLALGFVGVALVVGGRAQLGIPAGDLWHMLWPALIALFGITIGTLYQKRFCPKFELRTGSVIQFLPVFIVTGFIAVQTETLQIEWDGRFIFALLWLVLVLSVGAVSLLNVLIRQGSATNVASLFYLTPPVTAVIAWALFDETLSPMAIAGMGVAVGGVWLARRA
ncbi:DMT family transporter [Denitromonas ohlonensis]|uniref:DMT family transporter n=2 Tax=Denitromonas TaxID=139331 RepID=A0A557RRZ3_9RHOO|nr:DMT family transporter [Denitromonas ohlonensis]TVO67905.1 DMT family transporter [Denitromonas ohlonensis]TVO78190.1 DMT family transporter [Denitromonas ohlonensis]